MAPLNSENTQASDKTKDIFVGNGGLKSLLNAQFIQSNVCRREVVEMCRLRRPAFGRSSKNGEDAPAEELPDQQGSNALRRR